MVLEIVAGERTCRMCRGVVGKMRGGGVPAGTIETRRRRKKTRGAATWLRHGCAVVSKTRLSGRRAIRSHV